MPLRDRLPPWLKPSARTDVAQLLAGIRPVMRSELAKPVQTSVLRNWARQHRCFVALDEDGFVAFSLRPGLGRRLLELDRAPGDHLKRLGVWLGYPSCCCRAADRGGESKLDDWAEEVAARKFIGRERMIDPSGYLRGHSLISHIPCSPRCCISVKMAARLVLSLRCIQAPCWSRFHARRNHYSVSQRRKRS